MDREVLKARVEAVRSAIESASGGRAVELCAVTKTVDAETANLLIDLNVRTIGENRVQAIRQKLPALNPDFRLHLIGQLQTNKVKYIVRDVAMVQSLDRMPLAQELNRRAAEAQIIMPALVQVNVAREPQKAGLSEEELPVFLKQARALSNLSIQGLMAIMPIAQDPEGVRPYFCRMKQLFDRLRDEAIDGVQMDILSMGMTHDYIVAVQEGATMVRIGSALFGG